MQENDFLLKTKCTQAIVFEKMFFIGMESQKTRGIHQMLFQCWPTVFCAGPTLKQHWLNDTFSWYPIHLIHGVEGLIKKVLLITYRSWVALLMQHTVQGRRHMVSQQLMPFHLQSTHKHINQNQTYTSIKPVCLRLNTLKCNFFY